MHILTQKPARQVRSEAELARRGKLEQERDLEEERVATKLGREVERQLSRCEDLFQLRDKLFKKEEETCARKRGEELSRRERDRGELVVKEEMRVAEFDESARCPPPPPNSSFCDRSAGPGLTPSHSYRLSAVC